MRAPTRIMLATWVQQAWDKISREIIVKSFKVCSNFSKLPYQVLYLCLLVLLHFKSIRDDGAMTNRINYFFTSTF